MMEDTEWLLSDYGAPENGGKSETVMRVYDGTDYSQYPIRVDLDLATFRRFSYLNGWILWTRLDNTGIFAEKSKD